MAAVPAGKRASPASALLLLLLGLCASVCSERALAQSPGPGLLQGNPPLARHAIDASLATSSFSVVQDAQGWVHVGSATGVLSHDGERWRALALGNGDMVRRLQLAADGRVLVGGYGAFGYLERNAAGELGFVDLTPRALPFLQGRELADIWDIVVSADAIWFRALRDVFRWDPQSGELQHWHHEGRFGAMVDDPAGPLLQFRGVGLHRFVDGRWELLPQTRVLTGLVHRLVGLGDGSWLGLARDGNWWRLQGDQLRVQARPAGLPPPTHFEHTLALSDGSLALAGADGSLYLVDARLQGWQRLQVATEFLSGLAPARDGGLLLVTDEAYFHVSWPSAWTQLGAEDGLRGTLFGVADWSGATHVLSSAGVGRLIPQSDNGARVAMLPLVTTAAHALHPLDDRRALLADNMDLLLVEDGIARPLFEEPIYPREFHPSRFHPDRIYVGTEMGLRVLQRAAGDRPGDTRIELRPRLADDREVRTLGLVETAADEVWFGSVRHGLWWARLAADGQLLEQGNLRPPGWVDEGRPSTATVFRDADGVLWAGTEVGLFRVEAGRLLAAAAPDTPPLTPADGPLSLAQGGDGTLWAYARSRVFRRAPGQGWLEEPVQPLLRGALVAHRVGPDGSLLLISTRGLLSYDPQRSTPTGAAAEVQLSAVERVWPDGRREAQPLKPAAPLRLAAGDYAISFQFALADLAAPQAAHYRARLRGYEEPWSDWSRSRSFSYSRLRPGAYELELEARDGRGRISRIEPWRLVVEPPWHGRPWARAALALAALLLVVGLLRWWLRLRLARLDGDRMRLAQQVEERTRELATANQRLQQMAHQDGLTGIANRRRLDAVLAARIAEALARGESLALLAIDVDHFKQYNDSHGHLAGDELLKTLAGLLAAALPPGDALLARFGGEEFMVVLPATGLTEALAIAANMRASVQAADIGSTVSIGVSAARPQGLDPAPLLEAADRALYAAKASGRNAVVAAPSPSDLA